MWWWFCLYSWVSMEFYNTPFPTIILHYPVDVCATYHHDDATLTLLNVLLWILLQIRCSRCCPFSRVYWNWYRNPFWSAFRVFLRNCEGRMWKRGENEVMRIANGRKIGKEEEKGRKNGKRGKKRKKRAYLFH